MTPALRAQVLREWQPFARFDPPAKPAPALRQLMPGIRKGLGLEQRLHQSQVFHQWLEIVGADIAKHAQPVSLKNGLLVIAVDHPVWLQELARYHKPLLLQKIRDRIGKTAVRELVFRIG